MKKPLLDVIFASEKRKGVLLLLQNGATEMEHLLSALNTTRQALLPQIRILEEHHLVSHDKDTYDLTTIGKLIVERMTPLLNTLDTLEIDIDYWGTHDLSFIASDLLKRINELSSCKIHEIAMHEIFDEDPQFIKDSKASTALFTVTSFRIVGFEKALVDLISNKVNMSLIISQESYEKVLHENPEMVNGLTKIEYVDSYIYPEKMRFMSFSVNDFSIVLRLLKKKGDFSNKRLVCSSESAIKWGKELFDHYLKNSSPAAEIEG
jgi:predicted transcriptional regulator